MARLRSSGAASVTPYRDKESLRETLGELGIAGAFNGKAVEDIYWRLATVIGMWSQEQDRLDSAPVAAALLSSAKELSAVSKLIGGVEEGFHSDFEIVFAVRVAEFLALDPAVGSLLKAHELMSSFSQEAARFAHVCLVARADLISERGKDGRPALSWYDEFVKLLIEIAKQAGIEPTLRKDRDTHRYSGCLIDTAQALGAFFYPHMRSQSLEACGKRLERSRKRLSSRPKKQKS